jgi:CBS domain-containing protein
LENRYNHINEKEVAMPDLSLHKKAQRLRIYIGESDSWRGKALHTELLEMLRAKGMAGATVFRGVAGFGAHSRIHTTRMEILSFDLPVVIEVVDTAENIEAILDVVYPMVREGLITVEDVQIVKYTHRFLNPLPADRLVSDVMTPEVITLSPEAPIREAWKLMLEKQVKAAPVTDRAGKVVGILTDEDLLERAGVQQRLSVAIRMDASEINQELQAMENSPLTVADVMTKPVVTIFSDETLGVATSRMVKSGLKRLPVVNAKEKLVGILSRLDILRQVANSPFSLPAAHLPAGTLKIVRDIMSANIPMVSQDDDLSSIIEKFSKADSHRLIVVDSEGKAVGLISDSDVIARVQPSKRKGILDAFRQIGKPPVGKETAFDLMSPKPLTGSPDLPLVDAIKIMLADSRKWLVAVDEKGRPLGLVDRQILFEAIASIR